MPDFYSSWIVTNPEATKNPVVNLPFAKQYCRDVAYHEMTRMLVMFPPIQTTKIYDKWGGDIMYYARWHWARNHASQLSFRNEIGHTGNKTVMDKSRNHWTPKIVEELRLRFPMLQFSQGEKQAFSGPIPTVISEGDNHVPIAFYWAVYLQRLVSGSYTLEPEWDGSIHELMMLIGDHWHKAVWTSLVEGRPLDPIMYLTHNTGPIGMRQKLYTMNEARYATLLRAREQGEFPEDLERQWQLGDRI